MANTMAFTYRVLENGARNVTLQVTGVDATTTVAATQDGAATALFATNVSGYTPIKSLKIRRILYNTVNCIAQLQWHATSNVNLALLSGYGDYEMEKWGMANQGFWNDGGAGVSGDVDLNSVAIASVTAGATNPITAFMTLVLFGTKGA